MLRPRFLQAYMMSATAMWRQTRWCRHSPQASRAPPPTGSRASAARAPSTGAVRQQLKCQTAMALL